MQIVTLGESLIGLASTGRRLESARMLEKSVGGAESNAAIGWSRLGHRVSYVGRVGDDPPGREVERTLRGEGVDTTHLMVDPDRATGLMLKERRGDGTVSVHYYRAGAAGSALQVDDVPQDVVAAADLLHVTGITVALGDAPRRAVRHAIEVARDAGVTVSYDANFRHKLASGEQLVAQFEDLVGLADHVLLSWNDAATCAGSSDPARIEAYVEQLGRPVVVLKGRRGGGRAYEHGVRTAETEPVEARVVDPIGAGDGFAVGYLHGVLEDQDRACSLAAGAWVAAQVIAHPGDFEGLPSRAELEAVDHDRVVDR